MKKGYFLIIFLSLNFSLLAQYNPLHIPDTLSGTTFNLELIDTAKQISTGSTTHTNGINSDFWGPTLFINRGDSVHMNVINHLPDTTTIHWHGMHLPAMMDGGPHQPIPPNTTWSPYWKMDNNAATYWFHPHLHMMALHQVTMGCGGLLIVRDSVESALPLPRTYGVDDIPLVISDRRFDVNNQFVDVTYGDTVLINGTLNPETTVPSQVVRFRILNAALERCYRIGFSDNRQFYVITSDGGLLSAPVGVTQYLLCAAERIEILVDFSGQNGQATDLMAFNHNLPPAIPGFEPAVGGPLANALGNRDFNLVHFNVGSQTPNPITAIPSSLTTVTPIDETTANLTRSLSIVDTTINGVPGFAINHRTFDMSFNDYDVPLNNTEIWSITNTSVIAHPFHIHDIEFNILDRNGVAPPLAERGWKDVVNVRRNETVRFIGRFTDFADSLHPFMFHCHIAAHEDGGLMGQFIVINSVNGINEISDDGLNIFPNPASKSINISVKEQGKNTLTIYSMQGQKLLEEVFYENEHTLSLETLSPGIYMIDIEGKLRYRKLLQVIR